VGAPDHRSRQRHRAGLLARVALLLTVVLVVAVTV
jgi:hypothetical protein